MEGLKEEGVRMKRKEREKDGRREKGGLRNEEQIDKGRRKECKEGKTKGWKEVL